MGDLYSFDAFPDLDALAKAQGVKPTTDIDEFKAEFWPEDESVEDFIAACKGWRRDGEREVMEVMNAVEAGDFLRVSPRTIRELARKGRLPGHKIGKEWRFTRSSLLAFIEDSGGFSTRMNQKP